MTQPTERQVLYALVAGGFLAVVGVLTVVAWSTGLSPIGWVVTMGVIWAVACTYCAVRWRRTGQVLLISVGSFIVWTIGTLATI